MNMLIPKFKKHGFLFQNYNYLGPLNEYSNEPIDVIDELCKIHDIGYDRIIKQTNNDSYPYIHYNVADENLLVGINNINIIEFNNIQIEACEIIIGFLNFKQMMCSKDLRNY